MDLAQNVQKGEEEVVSSRNYGHWIISVGLTLLGSIMVGPELGRKENRCNRRTRSELPDTFPAAQTSIYLEL